MISDWISARLGDVTTKIGSGATPSGGENAYKAQGTSLIRSLNVHDGEFRYKDLAFIDKDQSARLGNVIVEPGDVLLNITGASVARCCVVPTGVLPARVNQHVAIVRPKASRLLPQFLQYMLVSDQYKEQLLSTGEGAGSTRQALTKAQLQCFLVKFPESLEEQRRIVAILDEAFESIAVAKANTEQNLQNAGDLSEALLESCFSKHIDPSFEPRELADLCEFIVDCEHKTAPTQEEGFPSIRTPNIGKGRLILEDLNRVSEETYRAWTRRAVPQPGDLILAREAPAGNVAVIPDGMKVCLGQRTVLIRPRRDIFEPEYLAHLLLRRDSQLRLLAHSRGATVQHVNMNDIRAFRISSVPPLQRQRIAIGELAEIESACESLVATQERKFAALDDLKKSLLHQAFNGEL